MALFLNSFAVDLAPAKASLPYIDYDNWEESTSAKKKSFNALASWRFELKEQKSDAKQNRIRMVFLKGPQIPSGVSQGSFDLGDFSRIGCLLIEDALAAHLIKRGYDLEHGRFEQTALRRSPESPDPAVELATGLSFSAHRPFREEPYRFTLSFQLVVRAMFRDSLANSSLSKISPGMSVIYKPASMAPPELLEFKNRWLGRVRAIDSAAGTATVFCRDEQPRSLPLNDLRLEASPAAIKLYERLVRHKSGPSQIIRTIQRLKLSYTKDSRRNVTALRDRLDEIKRLLHQAGSSRDQLVVPLESFQIGSVSISLSPVEASSGEPW